MVLCSGITLARFEGSYVVLGIEPGLTTQSKLLNLGPTSPTQGELIFQRKLFFPFLNEKE